MCENVPAQDESFLTVDPDAHNVSIFAVVEVAGSANPRPDEPTVRENRTQPQKETRTWIKHIAASNNSSESILNNIYLIIIHVVFRTLIMNVSCVGLLLLLSTFNYPIRI